VSGVAQRSATRQRPSLGTREDVDRGADAGIAGWEDGLIVGGCRSLTRHENPFR
jgi:hypothetical protein